MYLLRPKRNTPAHGPLGGPRGAKTPLPIIGPRMERPVSPLRPIRRCSVCSAAKTTEYIEHNDMKGCLVRLGAKTTEHTERDIKIF